MSIAIEVSDADFLANRIGNRRIPDTTGLTHEYLFGGSYEESKANLADPSAADLVEIGAPIYGTGYMAIRSNGNELFPSYGAQTDFVAPDNFTIIMVVQRDLATSFGDWFYQNPDLTDLSTIGPLAGLRSYRFNPGSGNTYNLINNNGNGGNSGLVEYPASSVSSFVMIAMTAPLGERATTYLYDGGIRFSARSDFFGITRSDNPWIIGARSSSSPGSGDGKVAYLACLDRLFTAEELDAANASLKAFMATRSIPVS